MEGKSDSRYLNGSTFRIHVRLAPKVRHSPAAWGSAPGFDEIQRSVSAESAIHFRNELATQRPIETRFQRLITWRFQVLGRYPRLT